VVDAVALDDVPGLTAGTVQALACNALATRHAISSKKGGSKHGPAELLTPILEQLAAPPSWVGKLQVQPSASLTTERRLVDLNP
jgi:hypothetical protein